MKFTPGESPYPFVAMVPQSVSEALLADELRRKGGRVEYETEFISAEPRDDGVDATLDHKGEPVAMVAR
jgi:2-polyprenyl-6-methoxyphenol hydroxylase-like FAD-dependent oxidoreductase